MASQHSIKKRVEFSETDMAGIVHFSNYFRYMELVEHDFFRSLGTSIAPQPNDTQIGWPRVNASCDFKKPLRFEDTVILNLSVKRKTTRSLTYEIEFLKEETSDEYTLVAIGHITAVCVTKNPDGSIQARPIPDALDRIILAPSQ